jgi:hypothetical protein
VNFVATFKINNTTHSFVGTILPKPQAFQLANATLTYNNLNELAGRRSVTGTLGQNSITLNIGTGSYQVVITGDLTAALDDRTPVTGNIGVWLSA